jgi:hypothetical protein
VGISLITEETKTQRRVELAYCFATGVQMAYVEQINIRDI